MRFALAAAHQSPRPWAAGADHDRVRESLDQAAAADAAGFHGLWAPEHHFREEGSHAAAPAIFLAAAAQRAPRLRLGLGPVTLQPRVAHPSRLAEELATLDLVSGGRAELALAPDVTGVEAGAFGDDATAPSDAELEELIDVLARLLAEEPFHGWDGRVLRMPARTVLPRPLQRPHPPLWLAGRRPELVRRAAELGMGALLTRAIEPERLSAWVAEHRAVLASERCVPGGFAVNPRVAVVLPFHVHADEQEALDRGLEGAHFASYVASHYEVMGAHRPGVTDVWAEFEQRRERVGLATDVVRADGGPLALEVARDGLASERGAIGTPAQVVELLERYERAGVDEVVLAVATGRTAHAQVLECLALAGAEVLPAFAARADAAEAARDGAVEDASEHALARRAPLRTGDPGVSVGPVPAGRAQPAAEDELEELAIDRPATAVPVAPAPVPAPVLPADRQEAARPAAWRRVLETRGETAFRAFVRRADDARLERTVGSERGLRLLFAAMESQFAPERAGGFTGELSYELLGRDGRVRTWTLDVGPLGAHARPGPGADPRLTVKLALADFIRIAGRDLDAGAALLSGRMDLEGDFSLAARLGAMFGASGEG